MRTETGAVAGRPVVWSIAGSDSGGGAGLQADLLTMQDLGVHAATVVTALTAQNSIGVQAVRPVDDELFRQQLASLAGDLPPEAIKIGLLGSPAQVHHLVERIPVWRAQWPGLALVLDPVSVATSGDRLADAELFRSLCELLPLVDLITPNWPELAQLTGHHLVSEEAAIRAAEVLVRTTGTPVLVKGGHGAAQAADTTDADRLQGKLLRGGASCRDHLVLTDGRWTLTQPRLDTPHTHGTGCTLSSAWAAARALDYPPEDALVLASGYVQAGLRGAYATGAGAGSLARSGWPAAGVLPRVHRPDDIEPGVAFPGLRLPLGVYPVLADVDCLEALVEAGATTVQLRLKSTDPDIVRPAIERAVAAGRRHHAQVFINDHWRWAIELGAEGVHLGQEDLAVADLDAIARAGLRLGVSTHGYAELCRAITLKPSYIALGHVFPTRTKIMPSQPQGLDRLARYRTLVGRTCPTLAIGGVKRHHLPDLAARGVDGVALVTAITEAPDPVAAWRDLHRDWRRLQQQESTI